MLIPQPFPRWIDAPRTHSRRAILSTPVSHAQGTKEGSSACPSPEELARIEESAQKLAAQLVGAIERVRRSL